VDILKLGSECDMMDRVSSSLYIKKSAMVFSHSILPLNIELLSSVTRKQTGLGQTICYIQIQHRVSVYPADGSHRACSF
jgi:hypothetical protein